MDHSLSQFKHKFGGKKNITEKEWTTGIIPAIKKRALENKETDVYFHGDKLNPKRLKRGIDRYVADVSRDFMDLDTSTGTRFDIFSCTPRRWLTVFSSDRTKSQRSSLHYYSSISSIIATCQP